MSSTENLTAQTAFTAEYLVTSGPGAYETLAKSGDEFLALARETMNVHRWPSALEEGRRTLQAAAAELRQMALWLENPDYVEMLLQGGEHPAAYLFHLANTASPALNAIAESLTAALETPEEELCPLVADGSEAIAPDDDSRRLEFWRASQELMTASVTLRKLGQGRAGQNGALRQLVDLEEVVFEHLLPTLHHLTVTGHGAWGEPSLSLQRHLATLAECLRLWVPAIRRRAQALWLSLPASHRKPEEEQTPFPLSLLTGIDRLLAEALCPVIAQLEAIARQSPGQPDTTPQDPIQLWLHLDPAARDSPLLAEKEEVEA